jgi:hypothetical protein
VALTAGTNLGPYQKVLSLGATVRGALEEKRLAVVFAAVESP